LVLTLLWLVFFLPLSVMAAPYAAMVMDARNGEVLHARNADTRLHPASLTKMMTLYIAFEAVQNGELSMDTEVTISRHAASEPPSKLGLRAGQKIKLRYLVRAAAVKSANDAATAIGEAISGSEAAFARRMNRTAAAMGMTRTTFKNAHGLTQDGHLSTARDMTILGRHVFYDYPMYYNLFARQSTHAGVATVRHTNRRFLQDYAGADGIKTGYTRAAGFNLTASAERGGERIIATVFGGNSTASRNAKMAELLDLGFARAPAQVALRLPGKPPYLGETGHAIVANGPNPAPGNWGRATRTVRAAVTRSLRPAVRPGSTAPPMLADADVDLEAVIATIQSDDTPLADSADIPIAALRDEPTPAQEAEVVTRLSTSGGGHWGISLGRYPNQFAAEKVLLRTALSEIGTLDGALRKVVRSSAGFEATFNGLTEDQADLACRRLKARQMTCEALGPG
jgi:D-alanyl-D-alanine carboxypeptidase